MTETTEDPRRLVTEVLNRLEKHQRANTIALWTMIAFGWLGGVALLVFKYGWGVTGVECSHTLARFVWFFFGAACLSGIGCAVGLVALWTRPRRLE